MAIASAVFAVAGAAGSLSAAVPTFEATGVRIPLFDSDRTATIATLTVARASSDHQRFGAFSVKLLPRVVAEGVVLEIAQPPAAGEALRRLASQLRALGRSETFEARGFALRFPGEPQPRFTADRLRPVTGAKLSLLSVKGGTGHLGGERFAIPVGARLDCATGRVTWENARQVIHFDLIGGSISTNQLNPPGNTIRP